MKVKEFIKLEEDIDVYDDYTEELGICMCGPIELTEEGERVFADVLEYDVQIFPRVNEALVAVNDYEDCERRLYRAKFFFESAAGYCSVEDYEKWFKEV